MADKSGQSPSIWRQVGEYSGLAFMLPAAVLIGFAIGHVLDARFHTGRTLTVVFLFLGCAAGLIEIIRVAARK